MDQKGPPAPQKTPTSPPISPKSTKNDKRTLRLERWLRKSSHRTPASILDSSQALWMFPRVNP